MQLTVLLLLPSFMLANSPGKDFLITLNGAKLTGNIKSIHLSKTKSEISFENDLGDTYMINPATVYGFAFEEAGEISFYESKCLNGKWYFFKAEKKGQVLSLYTSSERQLQFTKSDEPPIIVEEKNPQIWLQFTGEPPFKVYRLTYRRLLRKRLKSFPDLAKRIGKRGFKYKNLSMIVDSYNRFHDNSK